MNMNVNNFNSRFRPAAELLRLKTLYEQDYQGFGFDYNYQLPIKRWLRRIRREYFTVFYANKHRLVQDLMMLSGHDYNFIDLFQLDLTAEYIEFLTYCLIFVIEVTNEGDAYTLGDILSFQFKTPKVIDQIEAIHVCVRLLDRPKQDIAHVKATISAWLLAGNMDAILVPQLDFGALMESLYNGAVNKVADFGNDVFKKMVTDFTSTIFDTVSEYCQIIGPMFAYVYVISAIPRIIKWHTGVEEDPENAPTKIDYIAVAICIGYLIVSENSCTPITALIFMVRDMLTQPKPQMNMVDPLVTLLQGWILTKYKWKLDVSTLKTLAHVGASRKGLVEMIESVLTLVQELGNLILSKMGYKYHFKSRATGFSDLDNYMTEVDQILSEWNQGILIFEPANATRLQITQAKGSELLKSSAMRNLSSAYTNLVLESNRKLTDILTRFNQANVWHTGLRFETICIMFSAPPNRQKSLHGKMWIDLCTNICSTKEEREMHRKSDRTFVFNRQPENVYWDAFSSLTKVVFCDDYGQVKVSSSNPSGDGESMGMIRMMNVFPMNMHCAKIESKGILQNNAKFCIATTNLKCLRGEDIVSADALRRRVNMWHCTFKPEFMLIEETETKSGSMRDYWNEKVNYKKLSEYCKLDWTADRDLTEHEILNINPDVWEYHKVDPRTGEIDDKAYSFEDLKIWVQNHYLERLGHYLNNQRVFTAYNERLEQELTDNGFFSRAEKMMERIKTDRVSTSSSSSNMDILQRLREDVKADKREVAVTDDFVNNAFNGSFGTAPLNNVDKEVENLVDKFIDEDLKPQVNSQGIWDLFIPKNGASATEDRIPGSFNVPNANLYSTEDNGTLMRNDFRDIGTHSTFNGQVLEDESIDLGDPQEYGSQLRFNLIETAPRIKKKHTLQELVELSYKKYGINFTSHPDKDTLDMCMQLDMREIEIFMSRLYLSINMSHQADIIQLTLLNNTVLFNLPFLVSELETSLSQPKLQLLRYCIASVLTAYKNHHMFIRGLLDINETVVPVPSIRLYSRWPMKLAWDTLGGLISSVCKRGPLLLKAAYDLTDNPMVIKSVKIFTFIGGITALFQLSSNLMGISEKPVPQSYDKISTPKSAKSGNLRKISEWSKKTPQILDKTGSDLCSSLFKSNTLQMGYTNDKGNFVTYGHVTGIKGHVALMNYHYIQYFFSIFEETPEFGDSPLEFRQQGKLLLKTDIKNFLSWFQSDDHADEDRDIVFFKFPITMKLFKDISDKFAPESLYKNLSHSRIYNMSTHRDCKDLATAEFKLSDNIAVPVNEPGKFYIIKDRVSYDIATLPGDCGTLLIIAASHFGSTRIVGIHSAGGKGTGFGTIITKEVLESLTEGLKTDQLSPQINDIWYEDPDTSLYDKHLYIGKTELHHKIGLSHNHIPSPLQSVCEPKTGNTVLVTTNGVSPLKKALDKFSKENPTEALDKEQTHALAYAVESLSMMMQKMIVPRHGKRLLTVQEAVWGNPEFEYISSLKSSSSSGCYLKKYDPKLKDNLYKEGCLRNENNPHFPTLMKYVDEWQAMLSDGIVPPDFYTFNLKDELIELEKVEQCKTRGFMGGSFISMVMFGIYFGAFRSTYLANRISNESSLGINTFSIEWTNLAEYMTRHKRDGVPYLNDGDYSGYDTSHSKRLLWIIFHIIDQWYNDEYSKQRRLLWRTLVDAYIVHNDNTILLVIGMCSGNFMTSCINTMINSLLFRYSFCRLLQVNELEEEEFTEHVSLTAHGDDNAWNTSIEEFDGKFVASAVAELGYTLTSAQKDGTVSDWKRLEDIEYLKRRFIYEPTLGMYVAPLRFSVVEEIPLWTNKKMPEDVFKTNIEVSIREAALHSKEVFESYRTRLINNLQKAAPEFVKCVSSRSRSSLVREIYYQDDLEESIKQAMMALSVDTDSGILSA